MKHEKGKFQLNKDGVHLEAGLSPWLRFCVGLAIVARATGTWALVILSALT